MFKLGAIEQMSIAYPSPSTNRHAQLMDTRTDLKIQPTHPIVDNIEMGDAQASTEPTFSIFSKWQRVTFVYIASVAAFTSPVSSSIYYPAMEILADDLNTTLTNISLTITTYMVRVDSAALIRSLNC
jgi:hypothetical protein